MTRKYGVRRGRCQSNFRVFDQKHKENAFCEYEITGKGVNLIGKKNLLHLQDEVTVEHSNGDVLTGT